MLGRKEKEKRVREMGELLTSQTFYYRNLQTCIKKNSMKNPSKPITQFQQLSGHSCFFIPTPISSNPVVILKQISGIEHLSVSVCVVD